MAATWLVKSSGRILGPFDSDKIIELLKSREVSVLDEISSPLRRWQTIQYHESFKDAVENLRRANVSEKTEATWTPGTMTSNLTQTLTDTVGDELTEEITNSLSGFTNTAKEIVIHNVNEQQTAAQSQAAGRFSAAQAQNVAIQRQVEKTTRGLWIVTMLVLLGVAAFIVQKRVSHGGAAGNSLSSLRTAVSSDLSTGQYADALKELKAFFPDPSQAGDLAIVYGSLLVQVEGQTVLGRRLLNMVAAQRGPETANAYSSLGVADILDNQLDSAQANFDKALAVEPKHIPSIVNSATVALLRGDYLKARTQSLRALQLVGLQGEALLTLAQAQILLFNSKGNTAELNQVGKLIADFRSKSWDYASELGFYGLYIDQQLHDANLEQKIIKYLDTDPDLTQDHRHNVFIYKGHVQWKVLARLCEQLSEKVGDNSTTSTLLASCYTHENRLDQARRAIDKAMTQAPRDALVNAWYYNVLRQSGENTNASVVIAHAMEFNRAGTFWLPTILQARFCQSSEQLDCARENWQRIYAGDNGPFLPAVAGLAWVQVHKGNRTEAVQLIDQGLKMSPDYIPLLQLRLKAGREGWYAPAG